MSSVLNPFQRAAAIAAKQFAAIAQDQARSAGLSSHQIRGLADRGVWQRPIRGVYVVAGSPDGPQQRLMIASLATRRAGGVISHMSAAAEHGLAAYPPLPHVTVPPTASAGRGTAKVHRSDVPLIDRMHRGPLVVTSVSRTIVDCSSVLERAAVEGIVDAAFCRKLATARSVNAAADRLGRGRRGIELARDAVAAWTPEIEPGSPAEMRVLRLLAELGVVGLVSQFEVFDTAGSFVARLDLADPAYRRGFEYDGVETHNARRWGRDEHRYARLRALGWDVQSLTKLDLLPGEPRLRRIADRWFASAAG